VHNFQKITRKAIAVASAILLMSGVIASPISQSGIIAKADPIQQTTLPYSGARNGENPLSSTTSSPDYCLTTTKTNILVDKPLDVKAYDSNQSVYNSVLGSFSCMTDGMAKDANFGIEHGGILIAQLDILI
jgi:hypothetical protein